MLVFFKMHGQERVDIGISGGGSSYMGDINESLPFYSPRLAKGLFIKYNFDDRHALNVGINNGRIAASASDFFDTKPHLPNANVDHGIWDVLVSGEFNFLPYDPMERNEKPFTPFINAGMSMVFDEGFARPRFSGLFGAGIKHKLTQRLDIGGRWTFRKLFADDLENIEMLAQNGSMIHNNDWVSIMGIYLSYNISGMNTECPAYDGEKKKERK